MIGGVWEKIWETRGELPEKSEVLWLHVPGPELR